MGTMSISRRFPRPGAGTSAKIVPSMEQVGAGELERAMSEVVVRFRAEPGARLHQRAYRALRMAILGAALPPGMKITEAAVLGALGLSRTPVREAFRLLEADGLVAYSPSRGVTVRGLGRDDLAEIYEMLESLESLAARLAAARIPGDVLGELGEAMEMMRFHAQRGRWDRVSGEGIRFHGLVYRGAGNARLERTLLELREYVRGARASSVLAPGRGPRSVEEHAAIHAAIVAREPEGAAEAARLHLRNSRRQALGS
jgi:DNA-binding GntR family transcriptional regulator